MAELDNSKYKGQFPSPILPKADLDKPETGYQVAQAIYNSCIYGENSFYAIRNTQFADNRTFASGKQPFQTYLDILGVDGKASYMNYSYNPRPIAPKFRNILVNDIMSRLESIDCTGLSASIQARKDDRKNEMAFKMKHGDFIKAAEQTTGMQLSQPSDFQPETDDELELWAGLNDKEKEETLMSEGISFILENNDQEGTKKLLAEDLVDCGLACEFTGFNGRKRIVNKRIRPEYLVYGTTLTLNFRNIPYIGHVERISILDVRLMYPDYPEKQLYELAYQFKGYYGNPDSLVDFIADYEIAYTRPYDSFLIDVMFFRYKVQKEINYSKGEDIYGNKIVEYRVIKDNPKKKNYKTYIPTWYQGAWLIGANDVLEWREMPNLIRNNEDVEDVMSGYAVYMLNNNGDMLPMSPMESIKSSIIQMDLAVLRMQNVLAKVAPPGVKIDLDAVAEMDLGTGQKSIGYMKLRELYQETGDIPFRSSKISGENTRNAPIEPIISGYGNMLQEQIAIYNFELNNIRDYLGINEVKDGSGVPARMGLGVANGAVQASNMSTAHIYNGYISILTDTAKATAILLWDALNTPETNDMYIRLLGKSNADFIKYNKDLTRSNYATKISVNMGAEDMQWLSEFLTTAVQQKQMMPDDAMMVKKYCKFDMEYGIRYLTFIQKKRQKEQQQIQQAQAQQQQQATAQQAQMQMQMKAQQEAASDKREVVKVDKKASGEHMNMLQALINDAIKINMETGAPIHPYVQNLIDNQHQLQLNQMEMQIKQMEEGLEEHDLQMTQVAQQQQMQQAQQAMQQQQGQQQGQPQGAAA